MFTKVDTKIGLVKHQFGLNSITKLLGKVAEMGLSENGVFPNIAFEWVTMGFLGTLFSDKATLVVSHPSFWCVMERVNFGHLLTDTFPSRNFLSWFYFPHMAPPKCIDHQVRASERKFHIRGKGLVGKDRKYDATKQVPWCNMHIRCMLSKFGAFLK